MRIKKARLLNWCQFEDQLLEFDDGLNAVLGVNGAGKSNAIDGIVYGLTGVSRNEGKLAGNIRHGMPARGKCGVELELEHQGQTLLLRRSVKPQSQELTFAGEKWDRAGQIAEKLTEVLHVDDDILLRYVFVAQWKIFEFLTYTDTARAKFMAHLFKTEYAERIWSELGNVEVSVPPPEADAEAVQARLDVNEKLLAEATQEADGLGDCPSVDETRDPDAVAVREWHIKTSLEAEAVSLLAQLSAALESHTSAKKELALAELECIPVRSLVQEQQAEERQARDGLAQANVIASALRSKRAAEQRAEDAQKGLQTLKEPAKPEDYTVPGCADERILDQLRAELAAMEKFLGTFDNPQAPAACPTCGTETTALSGKVREYQRQREDTRRGCDNIQSRLRMSRSYDEALKMYRWNKQTLQEKLDAAKAQILSAEIPTGSGRPEAELRAVIRECEENKAGLAELEKSCQLQREKLVASASRRDTLQGMLHVGQTKLDKLPVTKSQADEAQIRLDCKRRKRVLLESAQARQGVLQRAVYGDAALLRRVKEAAAAAEKARQTSLHMQEVRDVFHRERLPRRLAQAHLSRAERDINELLAEFNSPFQVHVQDSLRFQANFRDGRQVPAERLSGGEMTVFALAFRMAVNSRYARDLGLLVLDEPTAGLDEDNLSCLETALNRLRAVSRSRGLQVVLITHEKSLQNRFDREIVLPPRR